MTNTKHATQSLFNADHITAIRAADGDDAMFLVSRHGGDSIYDNAVLLTVVDVMPTHLSGYVVNLMTTLSGIVLVISSELMSIPHGDVRNVRHINCEDEREFDLIDNN